MSGEAPAGPNAIQRLLRRSHLAGMESEGDDLVAAVEAIHNEGPAPDDPSRVQIPQFLREGRDPPGIERSVQIAEAGMAKIAEDVAAEANPDLPLIVKHIGMSTRMVSYLEGRSAKFQEIINTMTEAKRQTDALLVGYRGLGGHLELHENGTPEPAAKKPARARKRVVTKPAAKKPARARKPKAPKSTPASASNPN